MLSPDFDLRDRNDDSQVWGRRLSNLETELQQMQDVSQLYHNPAYPTTDLRRWLQKGSIWSKVPAVTAARKPDDLEAEMECMMDGRNDAVEHGPEVGPVPCTVTAAPVLGPALPPSAGAGLPSVPEPVPHVSRNFELSAKDGLSAVPGPLVLEATGAQCPSKDGVIAANLQSTVPGPLAPETACAQGPSKDAVSRSRPTCSRDCVCTRMVANLQSAVPGPLAPETADVQASRKDGLVAANLQSAVPGPLAPETAIAQGPSKDGLVAANLQSAVPGPLAPETAIAQGPSKDGLVAANLQSAVPGPLGFETTSAQGPSKNGASLQSAVPGPGFIAGSLATVPCPLASEALLHETKDEEAQLQPGRSMPTCRSGSRFRRLLQHVRRCRSLQQGLTQVFMPHQFQALLQRLLASLPMPTMEAADWSPPSEIQLRWRASVSGVFVVCWTERRVCLQVWRGRPGLL